jgi:hypothetical protein
MLRGARGVVFRILLATAFALIAVLWPQASHAADRFAIVSLDLAAARGEAPTHLCVVTATKSPRTRQTLSELLQETPSDEGNGRNRRSWLVSPVAWGGDAESAERQRCTQEPGGDCRPKVELPPGLAEAGELYVACTPDSLTEGATDEGPRPVFVLLEHLEGSPPRVESLRLAGGVATIGVTADLDHVLVTARSLGGHYLPDKISARGLDDSGDDTSRVGPPRRNIALKLRPRCDFVEVRLPATRLSPADRDRLSVRVHGLPYDVDRCVGPLTGAEVLQVRIPPAPLGVGSIDVDLAATDDGRAAARYGASWEGEWPRAPFPLQWNQISFTWTRPKCIYPADRCPTATLSTGTPCTATIVEGEDEGCRYRCPGTVGDDALDLQFPLEVNFRKTDPVQKWEDKLVQNGQTLTSYVPTDELYLNANVNGWRTNEPANRIKEIEVFGEDGGVHRYSVSHVPNLQLKVPGASCEPIAFHIRGDRAHEDAVATVDNGQIEFGNPRRTTRRLGVNMFLGAGGGPAWSGAGNTDVPPVYFSGLAMLALQYRPRPPGWARFGFELRVGGTLGRWGASVDTAQDNAEPERNGTETDQEVRVFQWGRVLFEPGVVFAAHQRFGIGAGFGMGFSFPLRSRDDLTGDNLNFIYSPSIDGRFYIRNWVALVLQFRGVFGESAFRVRTSTVAEDDPENPPTAEDPRVEARRARSLLTVFGVMFGF